MSHDRSMYVCIRMLVRAIGVAGKKQNAGGTIVPGAGDGILPTLVGAG